jgi:hypothetical protein
MYAANANGPGSAHPDHRKTAHPHSRKTSPTYIGFRVTRYTPESTIDDVDCGFIGLMVVFARQNATRPKASNAAPTRASAMARGKRTNSRAGNAAELRDTPHIASPTSSATTGGGTLSSRVRKTFMAMPGASICRRAAPILHPRHGGRRGSPRPSAKYNARLGQHPAAHFPALSNSIVLPLSGTKAGTLTAFTKVSVLVPGRTLPSLVATSFACDAITEAGLTRSLIT